MVHIPRLHRLSRNVFGVTQLYHPADGTNAGFLITEEFIVHVDAGMTIKDGEYLLDSSIEKFGKKPEGVWLILTHNHSDHLFGMEVFVRRGAKVIAHERVHHFLNRWTLPSFRRMKNKYKPIIVEMISERTTHSREQVEEILGDIKLSLPDKTFEGDFTLNINGQDSLDLIHTPGHVPSEISVYHPASQTLFAGDTVYQGMPLTTKFGGPKEWKQWIKSLERLQQLDIKTIVPGHGKICEKDEIQRNINHLEALLAQH